MAFQPNIPQPTDFLSDSQADLLGNNQALDSVYGTDHYAFSNATVNNGKHKKVSTPDQTTAPVTVADPMFYGLQQTANLGVLQYSKGPSNAVPTPVTHLQSTSAAIVLGIGSTTNILDFTGINRAFCVVYAADVGVNVSIAKTMAFVIWTGSAFNISTIVTTPTLTVQNTGNILQLKNTSTGPGFAMNNIYWTLDMLRLE